MRPSRKLVAHRIGIFNIGIKPPGIHINDAFFLVEGNQSKPGNPDLCIVVAAVLVNDNFPRIPNCIHIILVSEGIFVFARVGISVLRPVDHRNTQLIG